MIRPILIEIALFLTPFVLYAVFLIATRAGVFTWESWPFKRVVWLLAIALVLMAGAFVYFANRGGAPVGTRYIPAHVDRDGNFVPGRLE